MNDLHIYEELAVSFRRELHQIPEIAEKEYKTSKYIINKLESFGITDIKKFYKTGIAAVIGDYKNPCIAFRADIDALPVKEETGLSFSSKHKGMMHACGHDGHTAVLLSLAKYLKDNEKNLQKCVKLIFQPAEEGNGGAESMIKEGVLKNPDVEKVFGFHLWPDIPVGKAEFSEGASFAEAQRYEIQIKGNGGHGAIPENVKKCLYAAAETIEKLKELNEKYEKTLVSACAINSTGYYNVFADEVVIKGTMRTLIGGTLAKAEADIKAFCESSPYGCELKPIFVYEYPCAVNHENELLELVNSAKAVLGNENVSEGKCTYAAEDFGYFTKSVKGAHIKIGTANPTLPNTQNPLHNPKFDIDENALKFALKIFIGLV